MLNKDVGKKWLQRGGVLPFLSNIFELDSENYGIYMYPHEFVHTGLQNIVRIIDDIRQHIAFPPSVLFSVRSS